jgi:hypothetical protein
VSEPGGGVGGVGGVGGSGVDGGVGVDGVDGVEGVDGVDGGGTSGGDPAEGGACGAGAGGAGGAGGVGGAGDGGVGAGGAGVCPGGVGAGGVEVPGPFGGCDGGFGPGAGFAAGAAAGTAGGGELCCRATMGVPPARCLVVPPRRAAALTWPCVLLVACGTGYVGTGFRRTIAGGPWRERSPGSSRCRGWTGVGKTIVGEGLRADDHSSPVTTKQPVARATASNRTRRTPTSSSARRTDPSAAALAGWAIVDSNHGPPPYQSGALTN